MATVNLGKVKLKWRGTYAGGTAYTPDDVVEYTDGSVTSSYICVTASTGNAPSSGGSAHSSWNYMAKGQATSPTTTQGDIIVRGASADERLGIGAAGKVLKVNSSANGYEFGDGGKILGMGTVRHTTATSFNLGSTNLNSAGIFYFPDSANAMLELTYNRQSATSNILCMGHYGADTSTNLHAFAAFITENQSIYKILGYDEHNFVRNYMDVSFSFMFTASELGSFTGNKRYVVGPGTGNSRTHTGSRCANVYGSYSDTSNSPHYSELTILEIQP